MAEKSGASAHFDTYEYVAVIIPGAVLLFGGLLFVPAMKTFFGGDKIDLGSFGLFLVAAFILGHLVRALSQRLETSWWRGRGGLPSDSYFKEKQTLIGATQKVRLDKAMKDHFAVVANSVPPKDYPGIVREIYLAVRDVKKIERIDAFNRTYGMFSGIASSFFILALYVAATDLGPLGWLTIPMNKEIIASVFFIAGCLSVYSMEAFGKNYARELAVEFIRIRKPTAKK